MRLDQESVLRGVGALSERLSQPAGLSAFNRVMAVISLVAGSAFLLGAGWFVHRSYVYEFFANHATAQGQVVENRRKYVRGGTSRTGASGLGWDSYQAIVRYRTRGGDDITLGDWIGLNPPSFSVGQTVTIFYDPEAPQHAMIDRGWKNYLLPGIPGLFGFLMLLGGVQRLFKAGRLTREAAPAATHP